MGEAKTKSKERALRFAMRATYPIRTVKFVLALVLAVPMFMIWFAAGCWTKNFWPWDAIKD